MKRFWNGGFSLPEITIALGLVGGISLVTMKLMQEQKQNEAYIRARSEIAKTVSLMQMTLNNPANCQSMLSGIQIGATIPSLKVTINKGEANESEKIYLETDPLETKNYGEFYLRSGDIRLEASPDLPTVANVVIDFRHNKLAMNQWGDKDDDDDAIITKKIPIVVTLDGTNRVSTCKPLISDSNLLAKQKFCEGLENAAEIDSNGDCKLKEVKCDWGEVPMNMSSLGSVDCVKVQHAMDLNTIFDTTSTCNVQSGGVRIIQSGTKLRLECPP